MTSQQRLILDHVALSDSGPTVAVTLAAGQSLAVVGRAGSGKSRFLSVLVGERAPARGEVRRHGTFAQVEPLAPSRRVDPQALASQPEDRRSRRRGSSVERAAEVLDATGLWHLRKESLAELSHGQVAVASLLPVLGGSADALVFDGELDTLDPWVLSRVLGLLKARAKDGVCALIATNRPEIAAEADVVIVLQEQEIRFAGSPQDLIRSTTPSRLEVGTNNCPGARAVAEPFEVMVSESEGLVRFEAADGQALAARLLLEGYGDVKFVVLREPTFAEALLQLI